MDSGEVRTTRGLRQPFCRAAALAVISPLTTRSARAGSSRFRRAITCSTRSGLMFVSQRFLSFPAGRPREEDAEGRGRFHVPPVTVLGVVETAVGRPRSSITEEERVTETARVREALAAVEQQITAP